MATPTKKGSKKRKSPKSKAYLHSAETAAERTIKERAMLILSARETEAFVDAIIHPAEPGPVLRGAARHYKTAIGR